MSSNCFPFRLMKTSNYDHHCNGPTDWLTLAVGVERDGGGDRERVKTLIHVAQFANFFSSTFCNFWFFCQVDPSHKQFTMQLKRREKEKFSAKWIHTNKHKWFSIQMFSIFGNKQFMITDHKRHHAVRLICNCDANSNEIVFIFVFIPISARSDEKPVAGETWVFLLFTTLRLLILLSRVISSNFEFHWREELVLQINTRTR